MFSIDHNDVVNDISMEKLTRNLRLSNQGSKAPSTSKWFQILRYTLRISCKREKMLCYAIEM